MTIATINQVFTDITGEVFIVYTGQEINPTYTAWSAPIPAAAQLLATAQAAQITMLQAAYAAAIVAPVTVTLASGTVATFATDAQTASNLSNVLVTNAKLGTWKPNYWLDVNGAVVTPVTYADLQNIAAAIQNVVVPDNQNLHTKIGQVIAATTVAAVQKITF